MLIAGSASIVTQGQTPAAKVGEWPTYGADLAEHALLAARSDQREQLQQAHAGVEAQDRQPGSAS